MDSNLWTRRTNSSKLSLSTTTNDTDQASRQAFPRRFGGDTSSHGQRSNPFNNALSPLSAASVSSPTGNASSAFALGSGAFASFGTTPKSAKPPSGIDFGKVAPYAAVLENKDKDFVRRSASSVVSSKASVSSLTTPSGNSMQHRLRWSWVIWYRPPMAKYSNYEKSTVALASFSSVEEFWTVFTHLARPSALPHISDYHMFRKGIRPVWEDEENKRGGKWIVRLKKGIADRFWQDLLIGLVGDQFAEAGEEVCGIVLSVRQQEDVLSIWTRIDGGRNIKIRETVKRLLAFPPDTIIIWKSHDDSIAQRGALDKAHQERTQGTHSSSTTDRGYSHKNSGNERRNGL